MWDAVHLTECNITCLGGGEKKGSIIKSETNRISKGP